MTKIYERDPYGRQIDGSGAYLGIVGHAQRPSGTFAWFAEDRGGWKRWYLHEAMGGTNGTKAG